ncbi:MAG: hypothetical protein ACRDZY_03735 [Acidimicrobiales bacterium]
MTVPPEVALPGAVVLELEELLLAPAVVELAAGAAVVELAEPPPLPPPEEQAVRARARTASPDVTTIRPERRFAMV